MNLWKGLWELQVLDDTVEKVVVGRGGSGRKVEEYRRGVTTLQAELPHVAVDLRDVLE